MTKEQAIVYLRFSGFSDEQIKAIEGAFTCDKTIPPFETSEDCVSRQAAIDALTKTSGIRGDALKALYDLPPVTPQPICEEREKGECPYYAG